MKNHSTLKILNSCQIENLVQVKNTPWKKSTCTESCPGKNVEACLGACPSNLEAFGVCVRVCNWRCPGGDKGGVQGGQGVRRDNCPTCPTCSAGPNFGGQEDYEEYDSTPYDEQQYEDYSESEDEYTNSDVEIVQAVNYDYDYGNEGSAGIARGMYILNFLSYLLTTSLHKKLILNFQDSSFKDSQLGFFPSRQFDKKFTKLRCHS